MRLATFVSILVVVVLTASQGFADIAILTSADFSFGYGATSMSGNVWTDTEAGDNTPTTQGDFTFAPAPVSVSGDYANGLGCTFVNRVLTDGGYDQVTGYDANFPMPVVASYSGSAPPDAAAVPNYKLTVDITEISIWGQSWNTPSSTLQWDETTPGNTQSSTPVAIASAGQLGSNFGLAWRYTPIVWDAGSYEVALSSLNDPVTRTFDITGNQTYFAGLDGLQVKGTVSLTYNAVPEPSTFCLLSIGLISLLAFTRKNRR